MSVDILTKLKNDRDKLSQLNGDSCVVDISHLRSFTNGNKEQEDELFELFNITLDLCLSQLFESIESSDDSIWSDTAHQLKGAAANLGANKLSGLCQKAENISNPNERELIIKDIESASSDVLDYIDGLASS